MKAFYLRRSYQSPRHHTFLFCDDFAQEGDIFDGRGVNRNDYHGRKYHNIADVEYIYAE